MSESDARDSELVLSLGKEELVIRQRYETLSILNDIMIALWFIAGSILFFSESTTRLGTWLFVIGSVELLVRPMIRLTRQVHLSRMRPNRPVSTEATWDF